MGALANRPAGPDPVALAAYKGDKDALALVTDEASITAALAQVDAWMVPLKERDRRFDLIDPAAIAKAISENDETRQMVEAVKMIGRKIRPDFSKEQATHWVAAVVASLTDLPPFVAVQACKAALHIPFEFPGQVEKGIRDEAVKVEARYRLARLRLQNLMREIREAARPKLPPAEVKPMDDDDWRKLGRSSIGRSLLGIGLKNGFIDQALHDEIINESPSEEKTNVDEN